MADKNKTSTNNHKLTNGKEHNSRYIGTSQVTQKLSPADLEFYTKYNRLPPKPKAGGGLLKVSMRWLQGGGRKYFDSGEYALKQAGKTVGEVGSQHPSPERIPHSTPGADASVKKDSNLATGGVDAME